MATRARFGRTLSGSYSPGATWAGNTFGVSATQLIQQVNRANAAVSTAATTSSTGGETGGFDLVQSIADDYDLSRPAVEAIFDPSLLNEGNRYAAAGGSDPKTARYPVLLRKPGDRMPTPYELRNQWAYDANREPIIGEGGETLDVNSSNIDDAIKFTYAGYIPPTGSPAYRALQEFYSSTGETLEQTLSRVGTTGQLGQPLEQYPTGLAEVKNKEAIPFSQAVVYNPPAYRTVQNPDGTTKIEYLTTSWNGQPAGYSVAADIATSPNNFPATQGNMVPDDPSFKPTPNPQFWILPNGNTTKSVPGSGTTIGFNNELWQWQTKPEEVGAKTTWELAATNPTTGKIDPLLVSRETAAALDKFGNLPQDFRYLITDSYSFYEPQVAPTAPISQQDTTTPNTPKPTTTPTPTPKPTTTPRPTTPSPVPAQPKVPTAPISIPKMTAL